MNIFVLSNDPIQAAKWHCDRHVVKMILETAQLLSGVFHLQALYAPYRLTHKNHPSAIWCRSSAANFAWTLVLGKALCKEYTERYGKIHKSEEVLQQIEQNWHKLSFPQIEMTPFALAMPEQYKQADAVEAYHYYYRYDKQHLHQWKQNKPDWIVDNSN